MKEFKMSVANCFLYEGKSVGSKKRRLSLSIQTVYLEEAKKGPATPIPNTVVRTDQIGDWTKYDEKNCKGPGCNRITKARCEKCDISLCFTAVSNCFKIFYNE